MPAADHALVPRLACRGGLWCKKRHGGRAMSNKRYHVELEAAERQALEALTRRGRIDARKLKRARVLLLADEADGGPGLPDEEVAQTVGCGVRTVERVRQRFVEEGFERALDGKPSERVYERKLDGNQEAHLIAMSCSSPGS